MMILGKVRLIALGTLLAALASPSLAGAPDDHANGDSKPVVSSGRENAQSSHSRRVELPFLIDRASPDREPRASAPREDAAPHPFREDLLKRASLTGMDAGPSANYRRLSRQPDFS
jgi:serine/threonine protein kinase HipA of HipAB toxin-antitoxin module